MTADVGSGAQPETATTLSSLIDEKSWPEVLSRLRSNPAEASQCVKRFYGPSLPLFDACKLQPPGDVIRALVDANESAISTADPFSSLIPLHVAVQFDASIDAVSALLEAYPRGVFRKEKVGEKLPIHLASQWGAAAEVVEMLLIVFPESIHVRDGEGKTPMVYAEESDNTEVIAVLRRGASYCAVSRAACTRMQEDFDEVMNGTVAASDARIDEMERDHAEEIELRCKLEEKLRANLKLMKVQYTAMEKEIRTILNEKKRLKFVQNGGFCPEADLAEKKARVEKLEDSFLESMGRMGDLLRDSTDKEGDPHFLADILETDLAVRTSELKESDDALKSSRAQVENLHYELEDAMSRNKEQKEEICRLNETIESIAECVTTLAVPQETLRRVTKERDNALSVVELSRRRFGLEGVKEEGECCVESVSCEGYIWQMGAGAESEKNDEWRNQEDRGENSVSVAGKSGKESVQTVETLATEEEKETVVTSVTLCDSMLSAADVTNVKQPEDDDGFHEDDEGFSSSFCGEVIQLNRKQIRSGNEASRELLEITASDFRNAAEERRKVLAVAENIDSKLAALQALIVENPHVLAGLGSTKNTDSTESLMTFSHRSSVRGGLECTVGIDGEEIELMMQDEIREEDDICDGENDIHLGKSCSKDGLCEEATFDLSVISAENSVLSAWSFDGTAASAATYDLGSPRNIMCSNSSTNTMWRKCFLASI